MAGWGLLPWGLGPWGGLPSPLAIEGADAVATRTVRVTLTRPVQAVSAIADGDALNVRTWSVVRLDNGDAFTVLGVTMFGDNEVDVLLLEPLASFAVMHRVSCPSLLGADGVTSMGSPSSWDFPGLVWEQEGREAEFDRDIANPPVVGQNLQGFGGTLLAVGGDYANEQGVELARKMAYRDVFTEPSSFTHLPGYGFGLGGRVKRGLNPSELPGLAADIKRVLLRRPWVEDAAAPMSFDTSNGILSIALKLKLKGQPDPATVKVQVLSTGQVVLL